jgi:acetoacetyl-CoA synthetase
MRDFFKGIANSGEGRMHRGRPTPSGDASYAEWHEWSTREPEAFWSAVWRYSGVLGEAGDVSRILIGGDRVAPPDPLTGPRWFTGAKLNFGENLLRRRDNGISLVSRLEDGTRRELTFRDLHVAAGEFAAALVAQGITAGDRIAGFMPNVPETIVAMLGAAWIGAVWSSCSPDFGVEGVLDRFGQIGPRVLVVADGYRYAGKTISTIGRAAEIVRALPSLERVIVVPVISAAPDLSAIPRASMWPDFLGEGATAPEFARLPFDHPLYVMYSSGTTGLPKCMVHGAGGTLLQHLKEHILHGDLRRDERIFYFTTCGWMMWNWVVSALAVGATLVLYDGAPMPPSNPAMLWDVTASEKLAVFGTSAKFLALTEKGGCRPRETHDLASLRLILSTGSPLAPASFDYVARDVKPTVHLASISGGTDIISCFALGNPLLPVRRGEIQSPGLGMAVDVFDELGEPVRGAPGELVCTKPFPSMPTAFWNDPDGAKYRAAYFDFYPGVWRHGDWAEFTASGGLIIHGRSDATLNPGGVRIGTAEIYRQVEQIPEVIESVVIGQEMTEGGSADVRIVLFVRLTENEALTDELSSRIRRRIRDAASPHHVPKLILQVADIPRTISGKITELAVREAFQGREVKNTAAMANPGALDEYRELGARHGVFS